MGERGDSLRRGRRGRGGGDRQGRRPAVHPVLIALAAVFGAAALAHVLWWWVLEPAFSGRQAPDPVAFAVGPLQVRWYGVLITASFLPAWYLAKPWARRIGWSEDDLIDALLIGVPLGLAGARLGFVIQNLGYYLSHPLAILWTRQGGLSMHGVMAGVIASAALLSRWKRVPTLAILDMVAPSVLLSQAIGRWGNFFNQELFGYPTAVPWKMYVAPAFRPPGFEDASFFHPTFLYESLWNLAAVAALLWLRRRVAGTRPSDTGISRTSLSRTAGARTRRSKAGTSAAARPGAARPGPELSAPGAIAGAYLALYSVGRFWVEFFRIGEPGTAGLTLAQWVSLGLVAAGVAMFLRARRAAGKISVTPARNIQE